VHDTLLFVAVAAAFAGGQWWDRRCIRAEFEALGHRIERIRWRPLAPFTARRPHWRAWFYTVTTQGPDGTTWRSRVATQVLAGVEILAREVMAEPSQEPARGATAPGRVTGIAPIAGEARSRVPYAAVAAACALGCLLLAGVPYWALPYRSADLPSSLYGPGLAAVTIAAAALRMAWPHRWRTTALLLAFAVVAVVGIRVAVDVARDPTSHNLFPFELAIAGAVGAAAALAGIGLGAFANRRLRGSA
jgi:hypothetical protein